MALNLIGSFQQGQQVRQNIRDRRAAEDAAAEETRTRNRMRELLGRGIPTTPAGREEFTRTIGAETGDPGLVIDWQRHFASQAPDALERAKKEAPFYTAALEGVSDQNSYDAARAYLAQQGIDASDMPDVYDPATIRMALQGSRYAGGLAGKPAAQTSAVKNAIALGLSPGTPEFDQYIREVTLKPGISIKTEAQIPTGMRAIRDAAGNLISYEAVPGSKAAREAAAAETAGEAKREREVSTANLVTEEIDNVLDLMDEATLPTTGFIGPYIAGISGTAAADMARSLDTIKANVGFDRLNQMRAESPTGGALGQVSEKENILLQSVLGSLDQSQSERQFRRNLKRLRRLQQKVIHKGISDEEADTLLAEVRKDNAPPLSLDTLNPDDLQGLSEEQLQELLR